MQSGSGREYRVKFKMKTKPEARLCTSQVRKLLSMSASSQGIFIYGYIYIYKGLNIYDGVSLTQPRRNTHINLGKAFCFLNLILIFKQLCAMLDGWLERKFTFKKPH